MAPVCGAAPRSTIPVRYAIAVTCRAPDGNPVVDPVPPTHHRVITTVHCDATMPQEAKNRPGAPGSQPGDCSDRLLGRWWNTTGYGSRGTDAAGCKKNNYFALVFFWGGYHYRYSGFSGGALRRWIRSCGRCSFKIFPVLAARAAGFPVLCHGLHWTRT